MLNIKNLFIISFSAILAAISIWALSQTTPLGPLSGYLLSGFLAGIVTLIVQSFTSNTKKPGTTHKKSARSISEPQSSTIKGKREKGTVKWFDSKKGYGFITRAMGEDIFVHFRSIEGNGYRSLQEGQSVEFVVTQGDKGPQAEDIRVI